MPTPQASISDDARTIWSAVGTLMAAGRSTDITSTLDSIYLRASQIGVEPADVAAFVVWTGVLPD